jgi:transposase
VNEALATRDPRDSRPVAIASQDEGRFGRISDPKPAWAPPGVRPKAPKQIVREYLYVYSAVAPALGNMTSLLLPYANSEMMNIFLNQVAEDFKEYFVVMLVDGAGWHRSKDLKIPENIRFVQQPSHSPELNPAEHIWEELRENACHNEAFDSLDELQDRLCTAINDLNDNPERLRSLTNFPYLMCDHFLNGNHKKVPL